MWQKGQLILAFAQLFVQVSIQVTTYLNIAKDLGIECFRGSLVNKIDRWFECAKQFNIKTFLNVDADDPFFDRTEMIRSLELLRSSDCDVVCPTKSSSSGVQVLVIR